MKLFCRESHKREFIPKPVILVLAENYLHYNYWMKLSGLKRQQATYISSPEMLYGYDERFATLVVYKTFWLRNDCDEFIHIASSRGLY